MNCILKFTRHDTYYLKVANIIFTQVANINSRAICMKTTLNLLFKTIIQILQ
jgi:hypothetical protein